MNRFERLTSYKMSTDILRMGVIFGISLKIIFSIKSDINTNYVKNLIIIYGLATFFYVIIELYYYAIPFVFIEEHLLINSCLLRNNASDSSKFISIFKELNLRKTEKDQDKYTFFEKEDYIVFLNSYSKFDGNLIITLFMILMFLIPVPIIGLKALVWVGLGSFIILLNTIYLKIEYKNLLKDLDNLSWGKRPYKRQSLDNLKVSETNQKLVDIEFEKIISDYELVKSTLGDIRVKNKYGDFSSLIEKYLKLKYGDNIFIDEVFSKDWNTLMELVKTIKGLRETHKLIPYKMKVIEKINNLLETSKNLFEAIEKKMANELDKIVEAELDSINFEDESLNTLIEDLKTNISLVDSALEQTNKNKNKDKIKSTNKKEKEQEVVFS